MEEYKGRLVLSAAGRDKGKVMCVTDCEGEFLLLADGRKRRVQAPKRKKLKHIRLTDFAVYSGPKTNKAIRKYIYQETGDKAAGIRGDKETGR